MAIFLLVVFAFLTYLMISIGRDCYLDYDNENRPDIRTALKRTGRISYLFAAVNVYCMFKIIAALFH